MKIVVNVRGTVKRVEIAVKMVITVEDMQTNEGEPDSAYKDGEMDEDGYEEDGECQCM